MEISRLKQINNGKHCLLLNDWIFKFGRFQRVHPKEYEVYLALKASGTARPIIEIESMQQIDGDENAPQSALLEQFFEIREHLPNRNITANCLTCQSQGLSNLLQGLWPSNLWAHLKVSSRQI